jgi:hypothetical protein
MTALYLPNSLNLPHVDIHRWAKDKKIFLPYDFRKTPEEEFRNLKLLAMKQFYIRGTPEQERQHFSEAMKESMKYLPGKGLSDTTVFILQIGFNVVFCIFVTILPRLAKI